MAHSASYVVSPRIYRGYLARFEGRTLNFTAVVGRYGEPRINLRFSLGFAESQTLLLCHCINFDYRIYIDHFWTMCTPEIHYVDLTEGDKIQFTATVERYLKNGRVGYTLHRLEKISKISK